MHLVVFHYHLRPGGVTGVVRDAVTVLLEKGTIERVTLVSGTEENLDSLQEQVTGAVPELDRDRLRVAVHPELRYAADIAGFDAAAATARLKGVLADHYLFPDAVWWVHNHHLGKNPAVTQAFVEVLAAHPTQRCLLEIHDFPEAGRYANLSYLTAHISVDPYPVLPNVHYAVLNHRDASVLRDAGIPAEHVSVLQNPVRSMPTDAADDRPRLSAATLAERYSGVDPEGALLLYPVRCIRRKNVLEAATLARLLEERTGRPMNLLVTLPGLSDQERRYSRMIEDAYARGIIPGAFGLGEELDALGVSFIDLMTNVDLVLSTSVQEGFGYAFFEGLASGVPLLARYLDVLAGTEELFDRFHTEFYRRLEVPFTSPSLSDIRPYLRSRYDEQLETVKPHLPAEAVEALEAQVAELLSGYTIDFSYLMPQMQYTVVADLRDATFRGDLAELNRELVAPAAALFTRRNSGGNLAVQAQYGGAAFRTAFTTAVDALNRRSAGGPSGGRFPRPENRPTGTQARILRRFATVEYLRLLYSGI
ncbi:MAG: hypothetical protein ACOCYG_09280 [Spirochaetota bacterium]